MNSQKSHLGIWKKVCTLVLSEYKDNNLEQQVFINIYPDCDPRERSVVSGDIYSDHHDPSDFHVDNIFIHNKAENSYKGYWLAPDHMKGIFTINLGCPLSFDGIQLVNTHNNNHRDRATKSFKYIQRGEMFLRRMIL